MNTILEIRDFIERKTYKNSDIDEETCRFYAKRTRPEGYWKNSQVQPKQCTKCHGRGTQVINQPHLARELLIACDCTVKTMKKHSVDMDKLYDNN